MAHSNPSRFCAGQDAGLDQFRREGREVGAAVWLSGNRPHCAAVAEVRSRKTSTRCATLELRGGFQAERSSPGAATHAERADYFRDISPLVLAPRIADPKPPGGVP